MNPQHRAIIFYIRPDCSHCQREIAALNDDIRFFEGIDLYLISHASVQAMNDFVQAYPNLKNNPSVTSLVDPFLDFMDFEGVRGTPSIFVFEIGLQEVHSFPGEAPMRAILDVFQSTR